MSAVVGLIIVGLITVSERVHGSLWFPTKSSRNSTNVLSRLPTFYFEGEVTTVSSRHATGRMLCAGEVVEHEGSDKVLCRPENRSLLERERQELMVVVERSSGVH